MELRRSREGEPVVQTAETKEDEINIESHSFEIVDANGDVRMSSMIEQHLDKDGNKELLTFKLATEQGEIDVLPAIELPNPQELVILITSNDHRYDRENHIVRIPEPNSATSIMVALHEFGHVKQTVEPPFTDLLNTIEDFRRTFDAQYRILNLDQVLEFAREHKMIKASEEEIDDLRGISNKFRSLQQSDPTSEKVQEELLAQFNRTFYRVMDLSVAIDYGEGLSIKQERNATAKAFAWVRTFRKALKEDLFFDVHGAEFAEGLTPEEIPAKLRGAFEHLCEQDSASVQEYMRFLLQSYKADNESIRDRDRGAS